MIIWHIKKKTKRSFLSFQLSNWTSCLIKQWVFTLKSENFDLVNVMAKFSFVAFLTRVSKSLRVSLHLMS
jgi:hypothetical protein